MVTPLFLLDTNVLSEPLRPAPSSRCLERMDRHRGRLATATVVLHEMVYGLERLPASRKRDAIREYLDQVVMGELAILPYDLEAALWHGRERARLDLSGRPTPYRDTQIAAIARVRGLVLVTANQKDFADLEGLKVENWL